jgi:hypothetical protein
LADSVIELLSKLKRIAPEHEVFDTWDPVFKPQPPVDDLVAERLHGVVG